MSTLYRQYALDECIGKDGYPPAWHDTLKYEVREEAEHRCLRCRHLYRPPVENGGEWSLCDRACLHGGEVVIVNPWDLTVNRYEKDIPDGMGGKTSAGEIALPPGPLVLARWRILTVHHLDGDKGNCRWWNLASLCQRCHLNIQRRVVMNRVYPFEHSDWFKPYAAGFYAFVYLHQDLSREETVGRLDELLALERIA